MLSKYTYIINDEFGIILRFSQQYMLPEFIAGEVRARKASPVGYIGSVAYWNCHLCGNTVLDGEEATFEEETAEETERPGSIISKEAINTMQLIVNDAEAKLSPMIDQLESFVKSQKIPDNSDLDELQCRMDLFKLVESKINEISLSEFPLRSVIKDLDIFVDKYGDSMDSDDAASIMQAIRDGDLTLFKGIFDWLPWYRNSYSLEFFEENPTRWNDYYFIPLKDNFNKLVKILNAVCELLLKYTDRPVVTKAKKYTIQFPVCESCFEENGYECKNCEFRTMNEDDVIKMSRDEEEYLCKECGVTCESCGGGTLKDDALSTGEGTYLCESCGSTCEGCGDAYPRDDLREYFGNYYCSSCSDAYGNCTECERDIVLEEAHYDEETDGTYCNRCYDKLEKEREDKGGDEIDQNDLDAAEKVIRKRHGDIVFPIDEVTLSESIIPALELVAKQRIPFDNQISFVLRRVQRKDVQEAIRYLAEQTDDINEVISTFKNNLESLRRFKEQYPDLKGLKLFPVKIKIEGNDKLPVFVMYPTQAMLRYANKIAPGTKEAYETYLKTWGTYPGALAYAIIRKSRDNFVVDTIKSDIIDQGSSLKDQSDNPALAWWFRTVKSFWEPYLIDALGEWGKEIEQKVYLTTFEMQKKKLKGTPDKEIKVYNEVPESMGKSTERVLARPEGLDLDDWRMYRLAQTLSKASDAFMKLATNKFR